eukprot:TRINITY_DN677_c4_g1_i3.p1 TRINITY_DN677_c4_g1~~TRINITY_DN677_c4_g1_i3.p1  ORF type:complete len:881 (-),score=219.79 TRINITY_DN677_c4_g1_i3:1112-3754(-)
MTEQVKRVKVYQLNDAGQWDDKGTGHVVYNTVGESLVLVVRGEENGDELLEHKVETGVDYQRQGDTIITWCETASGVDLALSFQEAGRCAEVWEQISATICKPAEDNAMTNSDDTHVVEEESDLTTSYLAWPEMTNLEEISNRIQQAAFAQKEHVANCVNKEGYLPRLFELFRQMEESKEPKLEVGRSFFNIFKGMFMLNDVAVLETILSEENILNVIKCLEYDPDLPADTNFHRHRDFMTKAKFKQVVEIKEPDVLQKIHQNYHMTYIKDVILLRYLDDATMGTLTSIIFFNNVVIVSRLSENNDFMRELFGKLQAAALLVEESKPTPTSTATKKEEVKEDDDSKLKDERKRARDDKDSLFMTKRQKKYLKDKREKKEKVYVVDWNERKDLFLFLQELVNLAKTLQLAIRGTFYKALVDYGVFKIIEDALIRNPPNEKHLWLWLVCADILTNILNHDPALLRSYLIHNRIGAKESLLGTFFNVAVSAEVPPGLAQQVSQILRMLLDPDSIPVGSDKDIFLDHVYAHHIQTLVDALSPPPEAPQKSASPTTSSSSSSSFSSSSSSSSSTASTNTLSSSFRLPPQRPSVWGYYLQGLKSIFKLVVMQPDPTPLYKPIDWINSSSPLQTAFSHKPISFSTIHSIRSATGVSINSILLTACTGALARVAKKKVNAKIVVEQQQQQKLLTDDCGRLAKLLHEQKTINSMVWVSMRSLENYDNYVEKQVCESDNSLGVVYVTLPVHPDLNPKERLEKVNYDSSICIKSPESSVACCLLAGFGYLPPCVSMFIWPHVSSKVSLSESYLIGPQKTLRIMGNPVHSFAFYVGPTLTIGTFITIAGYNGKIWFSTSVDTHVVPDAQEYIQACHDEIDSYVELFCKKKVN